MASVDDPPADEADSSLGLLGCCSVDSGSWPRWRYVQASQPLQAGDVVCCAAAHAVAVSEEWKRRICARCFTLADARLTVSCAACQQCWYCGDACQAQHQAAHEQVCPALQRWGQLKKTGKETMAVLRLLLEVLAREHSAIEQPAVIDLEASPSSETPALPGAPSFMALQHHPARWDTPKEALDWARCCASFRNAVEACKWCPWLSSGDGLPTRSPPPSDAELHALTSRIDSNCFGIFRPAPGESAPKTCLGRNVDLLGRGVYLDAALFNHSCAPNCSVTAGALLLEVVVDEAVAAGEELCISYCETQQPLAARNRLLRTHYHFECACERCVAESSCGGGMKLSYHSGGGPPKAPPSKKEKRDRREQKAAAKEGGSCCSAPPGHAGADADSSPRVLVDLRVLLKLAKAPTAAEARRGRKPGGRPPPIQVPTCCVRLRVSNEARG